MNTKPMVFPLDETGTLYVLQDENGREAGVGSRETCYTLLQLFFRPRASAPATKRSLSKKPARLRPGRSAVQPVKHEVAA